MPDNPTLIKDIVETLNKTSHLRTENWHVGDTRKLWLTHQTTNPDFHMRFSSVNRQRLCLWVDEHADDGCFELLARSLPIWGWYKESPDALWCYYNPSIWKRTRLGPTVDPVALEKQLTLEQQMRLIASDTAQEEKWPAPLRGMVSDWGVMSNQRDYGIVHNMYDMKSGMYWVSDGLLVSSQYYKGVDEQLLTSDAIDVEGVSFSRLRALTSTVDTAQEPVRRAAASCAFLPFSMLERLSGWAERLLKVDSRETTLVDISHRMDEEQEAKAARKHKEIVVYRAQTTLNGEIKDAGFVEQYSFSDSSQMKAHWIQRGKNVYIAPPDDLQPMYEELAKKLDKDPAWQTAVGATKNIETGDPFVKEVYAQVAKAISSVSIKVSEPDQVGGEVYRQAVRGNPDTLTAKVFPVHPNVPDDSYTKSHRRDIYVGYVCNYARYQEAEASKNGRLTDAVDKVCVSSKRFEYMFDFTALRHPYRRSHGRIFFHHHLWRNGNICNYLLQDLITAGTYSKGSSWWQDLVCFGALTTCLSKALSLPNSRITHRYLFDKSVFKHYLTPADTKVFAAWRNDIKDDNWGKLSNYTESYDNPNHVINDWMPTSGTKELIHFGERVMQVVDASKPLEAKKNVPTNTTRAIARMVDPNNSNSLIMTVEAIAKNRFTAKARAQFVRMAYPWYTKTVSQYAKSLGFNKTAPSQENRLHPNYKYAGLPVDQTTKAALRGVLPPHSDYEAFLTQSYKNFQKYKPESPKPGDPNPLT